MRRLCNLFFQATMWSAILSLLKVCLQLIPEIHDTTVHSPQWDLDGNVPIHSNGQQTEDGALCEDQHKAGDEEASMKMAAKARADGDGKRYGQESHCDVRHGQWYHEEVGDALEIAVEADGPAHQNVPYHGQNRNQQLKNNVDERRHGSINQYERTSSETHIVVLPIIAQWDSAT